MKNQKRSQHGRKMSSGGVRTIFDDLVSMAIRAVAHEILLRVSTMLADSMLPLGFKDYPCLCVFP
jgi:hypothetical protein